MADETTNAPVAGAEETATQQKMYVYYYSDPQGATKGQRFHPIYSENPFNPLPWHVHDKAPAESMVDPVWNDQLNGGLGGWQENNGTAQSQILAQVQEKLQEVDNKSKELDEKAKQFDAENEKIDSAVKTVQTQQQAGTTQTLALTKSIQELRDSQEKQNKLLASMQELMLTLAGSKTPATPEAPKENENTTDNK